MTWRKYFKPVNSVLPTGQRTASTTTYTSTSKYNNWLPEVYAGPPDRIQRYAVYDQMNYDHEISAALDTIADFGTEADPLTKLPFLIKYNDDPTPTEIQILEKSLSQWTRINKLSKRIWRMFRSTLVYGDQFFIRDPETFKLYWVDPSKVEKVIVNESEGKKIESYFIKDIDLNVKNLVATNQLNRMSSEAFGGSNVLFSPPMNGNINYVTTAYGQGGLSNYHDSGAVAVDAEHIVQLSLTEGMNASWPFGLSILEQIYKVFKQKELLEDAILIYRIHRAPERRMFFIDVGTMPPNKAHQYLERVKYEVQQKRIPSRNGGGSSIVDSTYNPMSMMEDYFFAVTSDGRGSKVETLAGGENLGCFALDTKVDLLDGRSLSIAEISQEINSGEQLWTYSCHPITGELAPGLISWAGKTKRNAKVMRITLDNGSEIVCTPDHKYPILGLGFVEAQNLKIGQALTAFTSRKTGSVYDANNKQWRDDIVIPDAAYIDNTTAEYVAGRISKLVDTDNVFVDVLNGKRKPTEDLLNGWQLNAYAAEVREFGGIKYNATLLALVTAEYLRLPTDDYDEFSKRVDDCSEIHDMLCELNELKEMRVDVNGILTAFNTEWAEFKTYHSTTPVYSETVRRITSIEYLAETMDVGTLTIDIDEKYHDYHTYALSAGVFVKNSIDDLKYFNNKMLRALGVPSSYLPTGPEDGTSAVSDGRVGSAFIQEFRFSKVVSRYQKQIVESLDREFKLFLKHRGITIDNSLFDLQFTEPQSFSEYRQLELDSAKINQFTALADVRYVSKRYLLRRYLGWTEGEVAENERMWREERRRTPGAVDTQSDTMGSGTAGLSDIGITSSGIDNMAPDMGDESGEEMDMDMEQPTTEPTDAGTPQ